MKKSMTILLFIFVLTIPVFGEYEERRPWYVSQAGNDACDGMSEPNAVLTLDAALDLILTDGNDGHTIWMKYSDVNYGETSYISEAGVNDVTIKGYYEDEGDMGFGGAYYKHATYGWVHQSSGAAGNEIQWIFDIARDNWRWENIRFKRIGGSINNFTDGGDGDANERSNYVWRNCRFEGSGGQRAMNLGYINGIHIIDCHFTGTWTDGSAGVCRFTSTNKNIEVAYNLFDFDRMKQQMIIAYGPATVHNNAFFVKTLQVDESILQFSQVAADGSTFFNNSFYWSEPNDNYTLTGTKIGDACSIDIYGYNNIFVNIDLPISDASTAMAKYGGDANSGNRFDYNFYSGNTETHGFSSALGLVDPCEGDWTPISKDALTNGAPLPYWGAVTQAGANPPMGVRGPGLTNVNVTSVANAAPESIEDVNSKIVIIDGIVDSILADTNDVQEDWASHLTKVEDVNSKVVVVDGLADSIVADTNDIQEDWATHITNIEDVNVKVMDVCDVIVARTIPSTSYFDPNADQVQDVNITRVFATIAANVPAGPATTFVGRLMQTWGRFYYKVTASSSTIKTYDTADAENTTQSVSSAAGITEVGKAAAP